MYASSPIPDGYVMRVNAYEFRHEYLNGKDDSSYGHTDAAIRIDRNPIKG